MIDRILYRINRILNSVFHNYAMRRNLEYETELRKRLKKDNFTLLSTNCIGGLIYQRLNKEFLSPTIGMWFHVEDFCKFCLNLDYYLGLELVETESRHTCPVGKLGDINIYFQHYKNFEEAKNKWNERKKRIVTDNICIICILHSQKEWNVVKKLIDTSNHKVIVLSNYPVEYKHVLYLKPSIRGLNRENYVDKNWLGFRKFERDFDFVSFINKE